MFAASMGICANALPSVPCAGDRSLYPPAWSKRMRLRLQHGPTSACSLSNTCSVAPPAAHARAWGVGDDEVARALAGELSPRVELVELRAIHARLGLVRGGDHHGVPESSLQGCRQVPPGEHAPILPQACLRTGHHSPLLGVHPAEVRRHGTHRLTPASFPPVALSPSKSDLSSNKFNALYWHWARQ